MLLLQYAREAREKKREFKFLLDTDAFAFHWVVEFFPYRPHVVNWHKCYIVHSLKWHEKKKGARKKRARYTNRKMRRAFFLMNVLNANKNYDALAGKSIDRAAINHGANAYYFKKLRSKGNKKIVRYSENRLYSQLFVWRVRFWFRFYVVLIFSFGHRSHLNGPNVQMSSRMTLSFESNFCELLQTSEIKLREKIWWVWEKKRSEYE